MSLLSSVLVYSFVIGVSGLLVLAGTTEAQRLSPRISLVAALLVALAVGLARGGAFGIPFMAVVVVAFSWRSHRKTAVERHAKPAALLFLLFVCIVDPGELQEWPPSSRTTARSLPGV